MSKILTLGNTAPPHTHAHLFSFFNIFKRLDKDNQLELFKKNSLSEISGMAKRSGISISC